jgi:hypothetical protein
VTFLQLADTLSSFSGEGGKGLFVNAGETAIEAISINEEVMPFWEWNGTDLTQFDSEDDGAEVTGSTWEVVSLYGTSWIKLTLATNASSGVGAKGISCSC